ncbi:hypothetical protein [Palleronia caenipelagi]|uniref:Uncharacterized protein n=1 Tax=Palleronia caenipelagi TaxID=2489174 RepID=A0A547PPN8_9RHOB|nr:hypothetical protein [Palleronia caenipelagi]TRD16106.1 hypothetical protein FEV53_14575 [Palleronia caenipelagi]
MAHAPTKTLTFKAFAAEPGDKEQCGDCGERRVDLPSSLPEIDDDFDWLVRDYDSFRMFMMEELAHRFPDRRRWTPADLEVVIIEALAAAIDRLSHTLDIVYNEHFLTTARRPESVRRLLSLIGYDAVARIDPDILDILPPLPMPPGGTPETDTERLERLWAHQPVYMEHARAEGPRRIGEQKRMVSLTDHADRLLEHPLVERAKARLVWTGAWNSILISVLLDDARALDALLNDDSKPAAPGGGPNTVSPSLWEAIQDYHIAEGLPLPIDLETLTTRHILQILIGHYRMIGSEVFLENARRAPITFWLSVQACDGYFRSEVRDGLAQVFSADEGGLFEPGNLGFGEDIYASDIIEAAMLVDGVETACLNRFKRLGRDFSDQADSGVIAIGPDEVAICQNIPGQPQRGLFDIAVIGGETG